MSQEHPAKELVGLVPITGACTYFGTGMLFHASQQPRVLQRFGGGGWEGRRELHTFRQSEQEVIGLSQLSKGYPGYT
jgi:hypothetical protein